MKQDEKTPAEDPPLSSAIESGQRSPVPFSTFTLWQKRWIIFLAMFAGMFSTISSLIFYPAITPIAEDLNISVGLVNLAVTTYMIVSGIIPAVLGNIADKTGRRPVYLFALFIYLVANIGLALQSSFPALLVLRMLQSAGSSGTISLAFGVIADIATAADRGSFVGVMYLGPTVTMAFGPVIGGAITATLSWRWIFWFLCISGGACLLLILFTLPETSRVLVGNGSIPAVGMNRTVISCLKGRKKERNSDMTVQESPKLILPNPFACFQLFLMKDNAIILVSNAIYYTVCVSMQASLSTIFINIYDLNSLQSGLVYLPFGMSCLIMSYLWGRFLNYDYVRTAKEVGMTADRVKGDNVDEFPIEKARLRSLFYPMIITTGSILAYGWVLQYNVHIAVPLVLQFVIGLTVTSVFISLSTLLTDLNSHRSSTAAASSNIVRCVMSAVALAILEIIIERAGVGWCFTISAVLIGACGPVLLVEMRRGHTWRKDRGAKELARNISAGSSQGET